MSKSTVFIFAVRYLEYNFRSRLHRSFMLCILDQNRSLNILHS